MTYTIHIGERDHNGWLPERAREDTRPAACARAKELLTALPFFGAEVRRDRRLVDSFVKRHPDDKGVGIPRGERRYYAGIRHAYSAPIRDVGLSRRDHPLGSAELVIGVTDMVSASEA